MFDSYGLPTIKININGKEHQALLDLGTKYGIHLPLVEANKMSTLKYTGETVKSANISGEVSESREFVIDTLKVSCLSLSDLSGLELTPWAASIGEYTINDDKEQIVVGLGFFKDKKLTINYVDNFVIIQESLDLANNAFFKAYTTSSEGISVDMKSEHKTYSMVLDTGASSSIIVTNNVSPKDKVKSCETDLGPDMKCKLFDSELRIAGHGFESNLLLYPINQRFKKDGLLGGDFFYKFIVEINFSDQTIALTPTAM